MSDPLPILVPIDGTGDMRAVEFAMQLAGVAGTSVRILSVVSDAGVAGDRKSAIAKAAASLSDVPFEVLVVVNDAIDDAIVEDAASASIVCMTTAATLLPHEGHFGSIAESVVRSLERSVLLLGPKAKGRLESTPARLVVPVDGSEAGEYIVEGAARMAALLGAEVWVVTVVSIEQERRVEAAVGHDYGALESGYVRRIARDIGRRAGAEAQFEVLHQSNPAEAILDFAGSDGMVAMSTHGRSGLARIFAGSVTTEVVAGSPQPVMVVRPPSHSLPG